MGEGTARVVVGRYRLLQPLGRGGMGAVWRAHDTLLGRDVAIKEIWLPSAGDEPIDPQDPVVRRALREAQAAARLRHPSIVTVHDVVTEAGRPWIVMELINGHTLADAIREHGVLTERRTAEIGLHVLDALHAAHRGGVAHRDVKPANILLDEERVVLTDFGIAAVDDATALTATGQMVGSPAYLAPERINGRPATVAADLWSLGVTLYTAVTGKSPFQRDDTQSTLAAILNSQPVTPAHAGLIWPVIKGLLIKDPARRLPTEQARKLLANVAARPEAPAAGESGGSRWPALSRKRKQDPDGLPRTAVAPPPTLAATTAWAEASGTPDAAATVPNPRIAEPLTGTTEAATDPQTAVAAAELPTAPLPATPEPVPLAPYPPAERRSRAVPTRTVWLAAAVVAAVLLAGTVLRATWPGPRDGDTDRSSVAAPPAASPSAATPSAAPSTPVNPSLDPCLVGTWRMTSVQVVNNFEGVDARFTGAGGVTMRIWPDGRGVDDYSKSAALTATINGAKYVEVLRGKRTMHNETRDGELLQSEFRGGPTYKVTRNGRSISIEVQASASHSLPYVCSDSRLTTYGDDSYSTQSYVRVSTSP